MDESTLKLKMGRLPCQMASQTGGLGFFVPRFGIIMI